MTKITNAINPGGLRVTDEPSQAKGKDNAPQRLRLSQTKQQQAEQQKPRAKPGAGAGPKPAAAGQGQAAKPPGPNADKKAPQPGQGKPPQQNKQGQPGGPNAGPKKGPGPNAGKGPGPGKPPQKPQPVTDVAAYQPVNQAGVRRRHRGALLSFFILVLLPMALAGWYLWERAADQYASTVGFSVRTEEVGSAIEILGGITELSGSSSSDTDILYEFLQSQKLVRDIDSKLDLRTIWSKPINDPIFAYDTSGTIEELLNHWQC